MYIVYWTTEGEGFHCIWDRPDDDGLICQTTESVWLVPGTED